jgi:sodium transport system ATP-binding protein
MLYTLMRPQSGEVCVDGLNASTQAIEVRKRLGVLPDARGLYKRLTARENIEYYGRLQGLSTDVINARVEKLIELLEMKDIAQRYTEGFSQGQRVKTAISRALIHDPRNIILDEPTNGLDVMATRSLREFLKTLRAEGRCVLFSTHIMQEVAALCDRIVIIAHGRVVAQGTAESLREQAGETNLEDAFVKLIGEEAETLQ